MTDETRRKILNHMAEVTEKACESREAALAFLVASGIATPDGQLTPEYGGPARPLRPKS